MPITVDPSRSPRLIWLDVGTDSVTVQSLVDDIRDWEDDNLSYDKLMSAAGKESLGGGVSVGITATLQNAQVAFTPDTTPEETGTATTGDATGIYLTDSVATFQTNGVAPGAMVINKTTGAVAIVLAIPSETMVETDGLTGGSRADWQIGDEYIVHNIVQKYVTGGNLLAVDDVGAEISPIFPTMLTQVVRSSSSAATLQELAAIEYASFDGGVTIDVTSTYSGTQYPVGTPQEPVNNLADAVTIATERGFVRIYVIGDLTIPSGGDYQGIQFYGESMTKSALTVDAGANVYRCEFYDAHVLGTLDGDSTLERCRIDDLNYVSGFVQRCVLEPGTITLGGGTTAHFLWCVSGVPGLSTPTIDCGGSGQALAIRGYDGGIRLINKTGPEAVSLDFDSGQVVLENTVTDGDIVLRGVGKLTDNGSTANIVNELVDSRYLLTTPRFLGLK